MRRHVVASLLVAVVALALLAFWWRRREVHDSKSHHSSSTSTPVASADPTTASSNGSSAPTSVRRLSPDQRREIRDRIAASLRRARVASSIGGGATTDGADPIIPLEKVGKPLHDALEQAIPILAECFEHAGSAARQDATAMMTMFSDPDIGTVIDTDAVKDSTGKPLDRDLETCLRDAIDSLELPPLGERGKLQIQYTFRF